MSGPAVTDAEHVVHEAEHAHPGEAVYIRIALVLAVLTAIEVGLYYTPLGDRLTTSVLLGLAACKFILVAGYFMHLKFDNRLLRRLFVMGLILAMFCYVAYLSTLGIFV